MSHVFVVKERSFPAPPRLCEKIMSDCMSEKGLSGIISGLVLLAVVGLSGGCGEKPYDANRMSCEISTANRSKNEIRFVSVITEHTRNEFGFLAGSKKNGKTSIGCDFELAPDTTIEWEENDKKCSAIVDMAKYIPKKRQIKSFSFLYKGDGTWDVIARSGIFDDSPEVKP
jgi:hypothetical protein